MNRKSFAPLDKLVTKIDKIGFATARLRFSAKHSGRYFYKMIVVQRERRYIARKRGHSF
jgi:hypothetical protein